MNEFTPLVSVILPVYNAENTIAEAIKSIIDQTYSNWELIIINDGSSDKTEDIILSFTDNRIKYYKNHGNKQLIYTLNRGLSLATGTFIARMDADDICLPSRFEKQVNLMIKHPDVIISGCQISYFGTKSKKYKKLKFPLKNSELKDMLAISTCFAHPTVMINKNLLDISGVQYNLDYKNAEDYCMWIDLEPYGNFLNLNETLLNYRISDTQISQPSNPMTIRSVIRCRKKYLERHLTKSCVESLFNKPIDISILKEVKKQTSNRKIWEGCYLSLYISLDIVLLV